MRRRDFVLCGAVATAAGLSPSTPAQAVGHTGFSDDIVIAFDGLDYPSWSASELSVGLMAFVSVSVPTELRSLHGDDVAVEGQVGPRPHARAMAGGSISIDPRRLRGRRLIGQSFRDTQLRWRYSYRTRALTLQEPPRGRPRIDSTSGSSTVNRTTSALTIGSCPF